MSEDKLIHGLVADLAPVRPAPPTPRTLLGWVSFGWCTVAALILWAGPLREGALATFAVSPRYTIEFLFAVLGGAAAAAAGFEWGVPGRPSRVRLAGPAAVFLGAWFGLVAYGLTDPVIETGMLGKRPFCDVQTVVFAIAPMALGLWALSRRALFARGITGFLLGIGAAAIPAASMQVACLYDPQHALIHHLAPVLLVGVIGATASRWILPRA
jgi:hypothetical protein